MSESKAESEKRLLWGAVASLMSATPITLIVISIVIKASPLPPIIAVLSAIGTVIVFLFWALVPFFIWEGLYNRRYDYD